jgi:hypothetical protein
MDPIAAVDQAQKEIAQIARLVASYHHDLEHHGMRPYEALVLTQDLANRLLSGEPAEDEDKP